MNEIIIYVSLKFVMQLSVVYIISLRIKVIVFVCYCKINNVEVILDSILMTYTKACYGVNNKLYYCN